MDITNENKALTVLVVLGIVTTTFIGLNKVFKHQTTIKPSNVNVKVLDNNKVQIAWTTDKQTSGAVVYSTYSDVCTGKTKQSFCLEKKEQTPTTKHKIVLDRLVPSKKYYFAIKIGDSVYKTNDENFQSFKTNPNPKSLTFGIASQNDQSDKKNNQNNSFNGFTNIGKGISQKIRSAVLGISTYKNPQDPNEIKYEEFKKAIKDNDLNYDFNHDNTVDTSDYPLYLEFVTNQED